MVGRQVRDPAAVDAMLATAPGQTLLGWSRALDVALLDHDPALPADRAWGGALLLVVLGLLLLVARRIRYPVFRHEGAISDASAARRRWRAWRRGGSGSPTLRRSTSSTSHAA